MDQAKVTINEAVWITEDKHRWCDVLVITNLLDWRTALDNDDECCEY